MSDYFRRLRDVAASAVKNKKIAMDTIIDDLITDTPELVNTPKLQDEFRAWAVENIENYMIDDSSIQSGLRGRMAESTRAYADLFNFKKWRNS